MRLCACERVCVFVSERERESESRYVSSCVDSCVFERERGGGRDVSSVMEIVTEEAN